MEAVPKIVRLLHGTNGRTDAQNADLARRILAAIEPEPEPELAAVESLPSFPSHLHVA